MNSSRHFLITLSNNNILLTINEKYKEPVAKEPVYWNDFPCEIPQLDIPDVGRNHILEFFLVTARKIFSVQDIYSDSLFGDPLTTNIKVLIFFPCFF